MLRFMATQEDVFPDAVTYLRIYFAGISGLLLYNIGSGILRAVGDTKRPLYFLILTSVLNIILDLLFVLVFRLGIAGVALATIISQFISAFLILVLLSRTQDIYRFVRYWLLAGSSARMTRTEKRSVGRCRKTS
jgi:Na+-driven multidrug efflux pump